MPNPTKNPDQSRKDHLPQREQQQDDRMPQRRDSGIREDDERIEAPEPADTQPIHRRDDDDRDDRDDGADAEPEER